MNFLSWFLVFITVIKTLVLPTFVSYLWIGGNYILCLIFGSGPVSFLYVERMNEWMDEWNNKIVIPTTTPWHENLETHWFHRIPKEYWMVEKEDVFLLKIFVVILSCVCYSHGNSCGTNVFQILPIDHLFSNRHKTIGAVVDGPGIYYENRVFNKKYW